MRKPPPGKRGYSLIAVNSDDDGERQKELLSLLRSQRVEGILLVIAAAPTPLNQLTRILDASIPMVCLDRIPDRVPVDSVSVDDVDAAEMGVAHLIAMGARRIAIATGAIALKNERRRLQGYRQALRGAGIAVDDELDLARQFPARRRERNLPRATLESRRAPGCGL